MPELGPVDQTVSLCSPVQSQETQPYLLSTLLFYRPKY